MKYRLALAFMAALLVSAGCAGLGPTTFIHPEYNFAFVERVAVIPFENLSGDQGAGSRASRLFVNELLAAEAFDVVEPGEVALALDNMGLVRTADLTREQIITLGLQLKAQGLFLGSVGESGINRSGSSGSSVVTISARLVEAETGVTIWSSTNTEDSRGFWSTLFGTGQKSRSEVTRRCVSRCIATLID